MSESAARRYCLSRREFVVAAGSMAFAVACGISPSSGTTPTPSKSKKIGFAMSTFTQPRYKNVDLPNFTKAVQAAGYQVVSNQANNDAALQATNVDDLLVQDLAVLAIIPVNSQAAVSMVKKANDAGVPVLVYNTPIPSALAKAFVGRDNIMMGMELAKQALKDQGLTGNWVSMGGDLGNAVADQTVIGFFDVMQPQIGSGKLTVVGKYNQKAFDPTIALSQAEEVLTKNKNDIKGFLAMNDPIGLACVQALKSQGLNGKVWVCGQDGTVGGCRAVLTGDFAITRFTKYDVMGTTGGQLAVKLAKRETLSSKSTYDTGEGKIPFFPIDQGPIVKDTLVAYLKVYSPSYVDAKAVFQGIPSNLWPPGAAELLNSQ